MTDAAEREMGAAGGGAHEAEAAPASAGAAGGGAAGGGDGGGAAGGGAGGGAVCAEAGAGGAACAEAGAYFALVGSLLFNEPSQEGIAILKDGGLFEQLPWADGLAQVEEGRRQMLDWLGSAPLEELAASARSDYLRLLVGIGKVLAAPWASVYTDADHLLLSEDTLLVRRFYERYGAMVAQKYHEPDDHIGLELQFLAHLLNAGEIGAAAEFAERFVAPWVGLWSADVQKHARTGYYRALAKLAAGGTAALAGKLVGEPSGGGTAALAGELVAMQE
jgi:TorA maturation chaperone TorD